MNPMYEKLAGLWPEMVMLAGACACMLVGLSPSLAVRRATSWVAGAALIGAGVAMWLTNRIALGRGAETGDLSLPISMLAFYTKPAVLAVGVLLLFISVRVPDQLRFTRGVETGVERFDPALVMRGEFFAFFLFSLTGVMLCAGASDLVWLFLSLELTSLPTYVMVAAARDRISAQEAAVKYFFLGAMAAAVFLYGFTLIYGAAGSTEFAAIHAAVLRDGASPLFVTGLVLAVVGIAFKIAAVPMHFYAADVYQGATTPVTAFLAFVPKTAGFVAIILLLQLATGPHAALPLPGAVTALLWVMAALTMTAGNVLGLLQTNVKRILAYSSIAHSGYMLVGLIAMSGAPGPGPGRSPAEGIAPVLFYLVAYGMANLAAFAVLGCLQARGEEAEELDDIAGLGRRHPLLAAIMLISMLSLIGLPPLVGFVGKLYLLRSAVDAGYLGLVVIAVLNSAVAAVYYLRIASACYFAEPAEGVTAIDAPARRVGAAAAALGAILLGVAGGRLIAAARMADPNAPVDPPTRVQAAEADDAARM